MGLTNMSSITIARTVRSVMAATLCLTLIACGGAEARKASHIRKGQDFLTAHNYDKARLEFRNALQIDPDNAQIRYFTAYATEEAGDVREAAILYKGALDIDETHPLARARLARLYALAGMNERALELVETQLGTHPDQPDLLAARGAARMRQGDVAGALSDAEHAVEVAPTHEDAVALLAAVYQRANRAADAISLLRRSIKTRPLSVSFQIILAQVLFAANRREEAETPLREAIRLEPDRLSHRYRLAQVQRANHHMAAAEQTLRDAIASHHDSIEAKTTLAEFLAETKSVDAADAELRAMSEREPRNLDLRLAEADFCEAHRKPDRAAQIYASIIEKDGTGTRGLIARNRLATAAMRARRVDRAQELIAEVLRANPGDRAALSMRAHLAIQRGDGTSAIADLRTLLRDDPDSASLQRAIARAYVLDKNQALAEETLRNSVRAHPSDTATRVDLVDLLLGQKRIADARAAMSDLQSSQPDADPELYLPAVVRLALSDGNYDSALAAVNKVIESHPDNAYAYNLRGRLQHTHGHSAEAVASFRMAIAKAPGWWPSYQGLAWVQEQAGHIDEAIQQYEALRRVDPASEVAMNNLAMLLVNYRSDKESLDRAAALTQSFANSDNPIFLDTYGWVLTKTGRAQAAVPALQRAVQSVPDAASMRYHLGVAQWNTGQLAQAHENLVAAVKSGEKFKGIDEAQAMLASADK